MYSSKKHSLINVPRTMRPLCKFQRRAGGCKNVNCLFRHENRVLYTPPSIDVKCDSEEAKKLKAIYEQPDFFSPKENRCPNIPFAPKDNAYRKTNTREKAELQMKLREKKRKLEEILSSFAADMENLAKKAKKGQPQDDSSVSQWQTALTSLENMNLKLNSETC